MIQHFARTIRLLTVAVFAAVTSTALASVQVSYDILKEYPTPGASASWVHSATPGGSGNAANFYGELMSSRVAGSLVGDLEGNVLSNLTGSVSGKLKQLSGYVSGGYEMGQVFELKFGAAAGDGKSGMLQFVSNDDGEFVGGWMDFSLQVNSTELLGGKLFFKPQAENGSPSLSPNRGDASAFTLWGLNWTHDSLPAIVGDTPPAYLDFLASLGHSGSVDRPTSGTLGVALFLSDPVTNHAPEPTALLIWGMLAIIGGTVGCRRNR
jgi:hypothetical protein